MIFDALCIDVDNLMFSVNLFKLSARTFQSRIQVVVLIVYIQIVYILSSNYNVSKAVSPNLARDYCKILALRMLCSVAKTPPSMRCFET